HRRSAKAWRTYVGSDVPIPAADGEALQPEIAAAVDELHAAGKESGGGGELEEEGLAFGGDVRGGVLIVGDVQIAELFAAGGEDEDVALLLVEEDLEVGAAAGGGELLDGAEIGGALGFADDD